jgi:hypothetical protein
MATEKEANKAREQFYSLFESMGIHSLGVDEVGKKGSGLFCVVAFVEKPNRKIPAELTIMISRKKVMVPVRVELSRKFKAE